MSNEGHHSTEASRPLNAEGEGPSTMVERGKLIVVCAPSGAGKSSLVEIALRRIERLRFSVSYTTRQPRGNERNGVNYFFVGTDEFCAMRDDGEFLESAEVHGKFYGTNRVQIERALDEGFDVLLDIDVQGAEQVRRRVEGALMVFVMPPSREALERRLRLRNLNEEEDLQRRLSNAGDEVKLWEVFDYVIVNDDLNRAYGELEAIIIADRCRPDRRAKHIRGIIATFEGE